LLVRPAGQWCQGLADLPLGKAATRRRGDVDSAGTP